MIKSSSTQMLFFEFLTPLIRSGKKTITIRDKTENNYVVGTQVEVITLEKNQKVCNIKIDSIKPIQFNEINEYHAQQEAMSLPALLKLIKEIYPNTNELFVIQYTLVTTN